MSSEKIRVGIVGAGGWAKYGHIPVLQALPEFEITAVSSRSKEKAERSAAEFGAKHAFDSEQDLVDSPDVDLVVVTAPAVDHARLAKLAIAAGKDVYTEWPLTTTTADSEELSALAEAKGVRHVVGLQRRFGPSARYTRDLVAQGYVGELRSVRMVVSVDAFVPVMSEKHAWAFPVENFSHVLSIYGGHFMDMLFRSVGFPKKLTAVVANQFPHFTVIETGEKVPNETPNEVMVVGTLEGGGLFSVVIEGAQQHRTGLQIDVTGTEGALRITNELGFLNRRDNAIEGVQGDEVPPGGEATKFAPLPVPTEYLLPALAHLDVSTQDLGYLYAAYANDRRSGTSEASNFRDAVRQHHLIDEIERASKAFFDR